MTGAIFYATTHGSTHDYAQWIAEATGLPAYNIHQGDVPLAQCDFVVLGCPIYYYKPLAADWIRSHAIDLCAKPLIFFTVSGAPAGEKLDGWLAASLPSDLLEHAHHIALQGRQTPKALRWYDRIMLIIAGLANRDRKAGREEIKGFDYVDKQSIQPIVERIKRLKALAPSDDTPRANVLPLHPGGQEKTG
jgi:menaquinone-dependent protoporphyrinogen IX oxidase